MRNVGCGIALLLVFFVTRAVPQQSQPGESPVTQWENLVPTIKTTLPKPCPNPDWDVKILDAAIVPPDGPSFAVVDYCEAAPSADWITVMELDADKPTFARFRDAHKRPIPQNFLQDATVTHFADVRIAPDRATILDFRQENDDKGLPLKCQVSAYIWNAATKTFDYNPQRSKESTHGECGE
jgi:hypothetical protein